MHVVILTRADRVRISAHRTSTRPSWIIGASCLPTLPASLSCANIGRAARGPVFDVPRVLVLAVGGIILYVLVCPRSQERRPTPLVIISLQLGATALLFLDTRWPAAEMGTSSRCRRSDTEGFEDTWRGSDGCVSTAWRRPIISRPIACPLIDTPPPLSSSIRNAYHTQEQAGRADSGVHVLEHRTM